MCGGHGIKHVDYTGFNGSCVACSE